MSPKRRLPKQRRSAPTGQSIPDARAAALFLLDRLDGGRTTLDALLEDATAAWARLSRRDRALFNQLVYGVLRWRLRLDAVITAHADRPIERIAPRVRNILRLALFQLCHMDRIPPSAAVNTAVDLARHNNAARAGGFINAVLRSHLRDPQRDGLPDAVGSPVDHLSVATSLPRWLASRWHDRFGLETALALGEAINRIPPMVLRCNTLKNTPADLMDALTDAATGIEPMASVPGALQLTGPQGPIFTLQAFQEGRFAIQDAAAQLVSLMLAPRPGETVLDACAGLGGKTGHIAQLMENRGTLVALDSVGSKLERLGSEMQRLGARIVEPRIVDLNHPLPTDALFQFDRILLDAPCSGLGVLRRNPDAKWSTGKRAIPRFAQRQRRFLDHLAPCLKPGGVLVYSVCSMEPEENDELIERFLKNHPDFAIDAKAAVAAPSVDPFIGADGYLRTFPHIHPMDGFFAARLVRTR